MTASDGLQFERAEFDQAPTTACASCKAPLVNHYYDVNGSTVCEKCRYAIEAHLTSGSAMGRIVRATGAGLGAAILGSGLYYAISALTGYELGLIAIVVGFGVGSAVRWGSGGRGGKGYQALAIALTYLAIVSTYIPPIIQEFSKMQSEESAEAGTSPAPVDAAATTAPSNPPVEVKQAGPLVTVLAVLFLLAFACIAPFLAGLQNIMGLVIIGIGLYEAWKLNRRTPVTITGPHALARPPVQAAGA
jgi:hypothetical protein